MITAKFETRTEYSSDAGWGLHSGAWVNCSYLILTCELCSYCVEWRYGGFSPSFDDLIKMREHVCKGAA